MPEKLTWLGISPARRAEVRADIEAGSEPRWSFYALMVTSALIAGLGLVANSPAVIIGAMLVSPLMTPIFGIALAMLRGDARLFCRALAAEAIGVVLSIGVALGLGWFLHGVEATAEMLSRTEPNLLDLLVAVLAGFAGAYALVTERLSPALPGVAIATAIVPPLSNTGLCLALGAQHGAVGSFVLFLTNFFSILVVGFLTFAAAGMAPAFHWRSVKDITRRFGLAAVGFLVIAALLVDPFILSVQERRTDRIVRQVLEEQIAMYPLVELDGFLQNRVDGEVEVIASVRSRRIITPHHVDGLQQVLGDALGTPTKLVVRSNMTMDVAALGSEAETVEGDLDGDLIKNSLTAEERSVRVVEQLLFEYLASEPGFALNDVSFDGGEDGPFALVKIQLSRSLSTREIGELRTLARSRLDEPDLEMVIEIDESILRSSHETVLPGWTTLSGMASESEARATELRRLICQAAEEIPDLFCVETHLNRDGARWRALVQVVGPAPPSPADTLALQQKIAARASEAIEVALWFRADTVVTPDGYRSYQNFAHGARAGKRDGPLTDQPPRTGGPP